MMDRSVVVLDFETSGLSPASGDRAIEIGAVLLRDGRIVDRFSSLMNPGFRVSGFIESYTGITNAMLRSAPQSADVMAEFWKFIESYPLVAHNASFDSRFLDAELKRIGKRRCRHFGCSMLVARRLYPDAPNHKLETLVKYKGLPTEGTYHRALADAEMTAHLWSCMVEDVKRSHGFTHVSFDLLAGLADISKNRVTAYLEKASSASL